MSGLGTTNLMNSYFKMHYLSRMHVIIGLTVLEIIDGLLLFVIIKSSWTSYNVNRRNASVYEFIKSLPFMKKLFLVSGGLIFFFNTAELSLEIAPIFYNEFLCSLIFSIGGLRLYCCMISIYTCYWARQYLLNSSPVLRTVIPKWFYIVSKASLAASTIGFTFPIISIVYQMYFLFKNSTGDLYVEARDKKCYDLAKRADLGRTLTTIGVLVFIQILYVFLFFKTLRFQQEANRNAARENNRNLTRLAKRCFVTAVISMVTDSITLIMAGFLPPQAAPILNVVVQADLTLNILTMIFCFQSVSEFMLQVKKTLCCGCYKQNEEDLPPNPKRAAEA